MTSRPLCVCILAVERPFVQRQGSSTYLDHLVRSLALTGATLHLRILQPPNHDQLRLSLEPDFLAPFASVALRGAVRRGARFYARNPANYLNRFRDRLGSGAPAPTGPWSLLRPGPEAAAWAAAEVAHLAPDWVIGNYFNAAEVFPALPSRHAGGPATAILTHDIFALRRESLAALGRPTDFDEAMTGREAAAFRAADLVLAIKPEEAAHIAAVAPGTAVATLPFAVDVAADTPAGDSAGPRPPVALFVGAVNPPNVDALAWLLAEIWPAVRTRNPAARLRVAGRVAESHAGPWPEGVEAVGFVPDLAPEYAEAAVVLAPIRFGSGVKIKLVEGLAHGLPAVATTGGAEGVGPLPGRVLRIADDAAGFAAAVAAALADPEAAATRAAARAEAAARWSRAAVAAALRADLDRVRAG